MSDEFFSASAFLESTANHVRAVAQEWMDTQSPLVERKVMESKSFFDAIRVALGERMQNWPIRNPDLKDKYKLISIDKTFVLVILNGTSFYGNPFDCDFKEDRNGVCGGCGVQHAFPMRHRLKGGNSFEDILGSVKGDDFKSIIEQEYGENGRIFKEIIPTDEDENRTVRLLNDMNKDAQKNFILYKYLLEGTKLVWVFQKQIGSVRVQDVRVDDPFNFHVMFLEDVAYQALGEVM